MTEPVEIMNPPVELQQLITAEMAWRYRIIPQKNEKDQLYFYCDKTVCDDEIREELEALLGKKILLVSTDSLKINKCLTSIYRKEEVNNHKSATIKTSSESEDFLDKLIAEAKNIRSSDIHIEPFEEFSRVRLRIDGHLVERYRLTKTDYPALVNRIKIRSNLDISEKRLPQDGRIFFNTNGSQFDIRVSLLPTLHGEKVVLRLLSRDTTQIELDSLGFSQQQLEAYLEEVKKNQGIILISGPTGSGKTTTLYATLKILNKENCNILTIEDPIEYTLEGINQVQLKESIGLTFSSALRTFLRQDPDIIMLGEIRDGETAQMAIRAALTGHLVLSTIHTNSAWGTISRLIDMGVPPFLVAGTLNMSLAQRLVRLLCPHCKTPVAFNPHSLPRTYIPTTKPDVQYEPVGCDLCYYTGYKGRKAVYEVIPIDLELEESIRNDSSSVYQLLENKNIRTLAFQAYDLFSQGETSLAEVYPILMNDTY
jgi:type IV pilus assembly protein PilB